jgi:rod shape determining protein RodA
MISRDITGGGRIDAGLTALWLGLMAIGWLMIYAVGYKSGYNNMDFVEFILKTRIGKQTIFIGVSLLLTLLIFSVDEKIWRVFAYPIYGSGLLLLVAVLIFGHEIHGNKSWFNIGGFGFQPVEVAKLGTALSLSSYLSSPSVSLRDSRAQTTVLGLICAPMFLVILQPDVGSMLVFFSFSIMLYREGMSGIPFIIALGLATVAILALMLNVNELVAYMMMLVLLVFAFNITQQQRLWLIGTVVLLIGSAYLLHIVKSPQLAISFLLAGVMGYLAVHSRRGRFKLVILTGGALFICCMLAFGTRFLFDNVLKKHHRDRINIWLNTDKVDPRGPAYNLNNSKMAIGSGGLQGKGFLEGTMTKLNFVPEQDTDFIFSTIGEEQGFIGVFGVVAIFLMFLFRIIQIAERQRANFVRLYAYCLAGIFFFHFFINIGMTMGVWPVVGIPLPFISAGGSSLMSFTVMVAILLRLDSHRYSS